VNEIERARISMMARSLKAPSIGRIQKRKTNLLQIIIFGLQRAAGPYRWANNDLLHGSKFGEISAGANLQLGAWTIWRQPIES
jgi:hypothetical protein